jgi:hypothetical protein
MKEKDPLLKLIEDWTGKEETSAKIILGFISFFCISLLIFSFYMVSELFKLIF